jgi:MoaA/NifB/PqqE/SkfB family radical SAM enzyme
MKVLPVKSLSVTKFPPKTLSGMICLMPFTTIDIDIHGDVRLCECSGWMPTSIGNLFQESLPDILDNHISRAIRRSITQGTYEYCDDTRCGVMANNQLVTKDLLSPDHVRLVDQPDQFTMPNIMRMAGDLTCNLSCPSCRTSVIKTSDQDRTAQEQLGLILKNNMFGRPSAQPMILSLSTSGELFASARLIKFVNSISVEQFPNLELHIQTNGILMPKKWHHLGDMRHRVTMITITTDAATAPTYEKLRRGGRWSEIQDALQWVSDHKAKTGVRLSMRMVLQRDNYQEIEQFYQQSKMIGADVVEYARLRDWGTYDPVQFREHDVFDQDHAEHAAAQRWLQKVKKYPDVFLCGGIE